MAARLVARKHQKVRRQRRDFHHKTALALVGAYDAIYLEDLWVANLVRNGSWPQASRMRVGANAVPSLPPKQHTLVSR